MLACQSRTPRLAPSSGTLGNNPAIRHFKCHTFAGKSKSSSSFTHAAHYGYTLFVYRLHYKSHVIAPLYQDDMGARRVSLEIYVFIKLFLNIINEALLPRYPSRCIQIWHMRAFAENQLQN